MFNPDTESWTLRKTDGEAPSKRASVGMATGPDGIFVFGGYEIEGFVPCITLINKLIYLTSYYFQVM